MFRVRYHVLRSRNATNFAWLGQYVEIEEDVVFTVEHRYVRRRSRGVGLPHRILSGHSGAASTFTDHGNVEFDRDALCRRRRDAPAGERSRVRRAHAPRREAEQ
jgi:hypothetical protein